MPSRFFATAITIAIAIVVMSAPVGMTASYADTALPEYQVKAAIVYKVAKFVSWPAASFDTGEASLKLCIAGRDPFGDHIDGIEGQIVHGRSLEIQRVDDKEIPAAGCHIVFVGEESTSIQLLRTEEIRNVLTVGDSPGFAANGGMLGLRIDNNRIRFEVNLDAARDSELEISASLLQLATIVTARRADDALVH